MYVGAGTLLLVGMDDGEIGLPRLYEYAAPARRFPLSLGALRQRATASRATPRIRACDCGRLARDPAAPYGVP